MESIGEKLKTAREQKGFTHDQISRDIHIARQYLAALEEEDFTVFPGETYLIGFLHNYADYLGIDSAELVSAYKHMRIQEQPIPVDQLLEKKKPFPFLIAGLAGGAVVIALVVILLTTAGGGGDSAGKDVTPVSAQKAEYTMDGTFFEKRLYGGDRLIVRLQSQSFAIEVKSISDSVKLGTPVGTSVLSLGEETGLDLTGDSLPDLMAYVRDLDKNDPNKGVEIRFELPSASRTPEASAPAVNSSVARADQPADSSQAALTPAAPATGSATTAASSSTTGTPPSEAAASVPIVLVESKNPYPFTTIFNFRGYCMFRLEIDRKEETERYFHKTETLTVSANDGIRVWVSNAASVKATVADKDFEFGGSGEIAAKSIKWIKDDSALPYKLTVVPFQ
jgi:cytoskeleton protein RodZ